MPVLFRTPAEHPQGLGGKATANYIAEKKLCKRIDLIIIGILNDRNIQLSH